MRIIFLDQRVNIYKYKKKVLQYNSIKFQVLYNNFNNKYILYIKIK